MHCGKFGVSTSPEKSDRLTNPGLEVALVIEWNPSRGPTLGVERYSVVAWPSDTRHLTIYADNDPPGLSGARHFRDDHPEIETHLRYSAQPGEDVDRLYRAVAGDRDAAMRRLLEE